MPIRDHFHPPMGHAWPWEPIHSGWISEIASRLNELLPRDFLALDRMRISGGLEIDIGTAVDEESLLAKPTNGTHGVGTAVAVAPSVYTPPNALGSVRFDIPDEIEVQIFDDRYGRKVVGAIELVSPANKDRPESRESFIAKCLNYLASGSSVVVVDFVTERRANLHNEIVQRLGAPATLELPEDTQLYAASYRPVSRKKVTAIDVWTHAFSVGDALPTMPLRLIADQFVPVELETTYTEACRRRRLI